ncbi:MAG TPA: STAS domain-containing protein [Sphingomonas sp.]|nr:STAS domain-containing protein [Sphingomonas sp.]
MNSPLSPSKWSEDRSLRLPAHCNTVAAEDLKVRLVLAADLDDEIRIDASQVESLGQAVLQLLVATCVEADAKSLAFEITDPSAAFIDRVTRCGMAARLGLQGERDRH